MKQNKLKKSILFLLFLTILLTISVGILSAEGTREKNDEFKITVAVLKVLLELPHQSFLAITFNLDLVSILSILYYLLPLRL